MFENLVQQPRPFGRLLLLLLLVRGLWWRPLLPGGRLLVGEDDLAVGGGVLGVAEDADRLLELGLLLRAQVVEYLALGVQLRCLTMFSQE